MFIPSGPLRRVDAIKPIFQANLSEFAKPGRSFSVHQRYVVGDYAYILWSAETADNLYEAATDTFVVRNGKIVAQSFAAKLTEAVRVIPRLIHYPRITVRSVRASIANQAAPR